jgi:hypothetical protein
MKYIFLVLSLFIIIVSNAQGKISGNIIHDNKPIEFATVTISNVKDTAKVLFYEATDSLGLFNFKNIEYGNYLIKIKLVGYMPIAKKVNLNSELKEVYLKDLNLSEIKSPE